MANSTGNSPENRKGKDNNRVTELKRFYNYLLEHVATSTMVSMATGIPQKHLTWYKRILEKEGRLWEVRLDKCQCTGAVAAYLTTDPSKAPSYPPQLSLF